MDSIVASDNSDQTISKIRISNIHQGQCNTLPDNVAHEAPQCFQKCFESCLVDIVNNKERNRYTVEDYEPYKEHIQKVEDPAHEGVEFATISVEIFCFGMLPGVDFIYVPRKLQNFV